MSSLAAHLRSIIANPSSVSPTQLLAGIRTFVLPEGYTCTLCDREAEEFLTNVLTQRTAGSIVSPGQEVSFDITYALEGRDCSVRQKDSDQPGSPTRSLYAQYTDQEIRQAKIQEQLERLERNRRALVLSEEQEIEKHWSQHDNGWLSGAKLLTRLEALGLPGTRSRPLQRVLKRRAEGGVVLMKEVLQAMIFVDGLPGPNIAAGYKNRMLADRNAPQGAPRMDSSVDVLRDASAGNPVDWMNDSSDYYKWTRKPVPFIPRLTKDSPSSPPQAPSALEDTPHHLAHLYTSGHQTSAEFLSGLRRMGYQVTSSLNLLVRRFEAEGAVSYREIMAELERQRRMEGVKSPQDLSKQMEERRDQILTPSRKPPFPVESGDLSARMPRSGRRSARAACNHGNIFTWNQPPTPLESTSLHPHPHRHPSHYDPSPRNRAGEGVDGRGGPGEGVDERGGGGVGALVDHVREHMVYNPLVEERSPEKVKMSQEARRVYESPSFSTLTSATSSTTSLPSSSRTQKGAFDPSKRQNHLNVLDWNDSGYSQLNHPGGKRQVMGGGKNISHVSWDQYPR